MAHLKGIRLKKKYGQHFLQKESVIHAMLDQVTLDSQTRVLEIGCGEGFLTRHILAEPIANLFAFEIDSDWATHIRSTIHDARLQIFEENFLTADLHFLETGAPYTILANLPYQVTFPILQRFKDHRDHIKEGVIMVQEEVAQKIAKKTGRGYGFVSIFFQWYFDWKLLLKVSPDAFIPQPKVDSRLLYFKPRKNNPEIIEIQKFWQFIKICFRQPRRTLRNNVSQSHYPMNIFPEEMLALRAQQLTMEDLIDLWHKIYLLIK